MSSIYTVTQINAYIKNMFAQDYLLARVCVKGEVSNCKYHPSGHLYFTLKDEGAAISCIMFAGSRKNLRFRLENGQKVIAFGSVGIYERGGTYQLYASEIRLDGLGELYERYEALRRELGEMGMFDEQYKQPVPKFIQTLGVVTASTGAAVRDIIQIAKRRNPGIRILLYPAKVQGEGAAESIVRGIEMLSRMPVDTIIIGRGGGSIEDLWAFNEESVARAVFSCPVPVISAVGHETDTVISDFVADLRAPTPSAAAELAVADVRQTLQDLGGLEAKMTAAMQRQIDSARMRHRQLLLQLQLASPDRRLGAMQQDLAGRRQALTHAMQLKLSAMRSRVKLSEAALLGRSPYEKLKEGYVFVTDSEGKRIARAKAAAQDQVLQLHFYDGTVTARVEKKDSGSQLTGSAQ